MKELILFKAFVTASSKTKSYLMSGYSKSNQKSIKFPNKKVAHPKTGEERGNLIYVCDQSSTKNKFSTTLFSFSLTRDILEQFPWRKMSGNVWKMIITSAENPNSKYLFGTLHDNISIIIINFYYIFF